MKLIYTSNNSAGRWWLTHHDWTALERNGWKIRWLDPKYLGPPAHNAYINVKDEAESKELIKRFEEITGQQSNEIGCECCGRPHIFYLQP